MGFQCFSATWGFEDITSSPAYPQSNGKVEQVVKTAKRSMCLAKESKSDPYLALLDFQNTPTQSMDSSPAQRLLGRRTQTLMPTKATLLKPQVQKSVSQQLEAMKERQAQYYNRGAKDLEPLSSGDTVSIAPAQGQKERRQGIVKKEVSTRSYEVKTNSGQTLHRNRRHLRKTSEDKKEPKVTKDDLDAPDMELTVKSTNTAPPISKQPMKSHSDVTSQKPSVATRSGRSVIKPNRLDM